MTKKPTLSIVIATKNRAQYCLQAIHANLSALDNSCELIVQDNSSSNELEQAVQEISDSRLHYFFHPASLSFVDNFNLAVERSSGEYICIMGDDDTVSPDILTIVQWMKRGNIDSLCTVKNVDYIWPNEAIERYRTGELTIPQFNGKLVNIDTKATLKQLMKDGVISYQKYGLPRIYHGIVKRECLDRIREIAGHYFGGLTPDMYSTIALSCVVKSHFVLDYPFSIAGACPASASIASMQGGHSGELSSAPHFRHRGTYTWEPLVPAYYSVETIWAETALKTLRDLKMDDIYRSFNLYRFLVCAVFANRKHILPLAIKKTLELPDHFTISRPIYWISLLYSSFRVMFGKALRFAGRKMGVLPSGVAHYAIRENVRSLQTALDATQEALKAQNLKLKEILGAHGQ